MALQRCISYLFTPSGLFATVVFLSFFAMAAALTSQYFFGLAPCPLCLYQRIPYLLAIFIGLIGYVLDKKGTVKGRKAALGLMGLTFLANTVIAAFHTGVERKWWKGLEGCSAPDMSGSLEDVLARIKAAPTVRCDEIPWADPFFGLSMANFNTIVCFGIFIYCLIVLFRLPKY